MLNKKQYNCNKLHGCKLLFATTLNLYLFKFILKTNLKYFLNKNLSFFKLTI